MSQAEIEARFLDKVESIGRGEVRPEQAFAEESDWLLEVEGQRFLLHPGLARWLVYDRAHDEWYDTEFGPGEALLVAVGKQAGAMRIPQVVGQGRPATVADWCLVADGERPPAVRLATDVRQDLAEGRLPAGVRVWEGGGAGWRAGELLVEPAPAGVQTASAPRSDVPQPAKDNVPGRAAQEPGLSAEPTPPQPARCAGCGAALGLRARFCGACGRPVADAETVQDVLCGLVGKVGLLRQEAFCLVITTKRLVFVRETEEMAREPAVLSRTPMADLLAAHSDNLEVPVSRVRRAQVLAPEAGLGQSRLELVTDDGEMSFALTGAGAAEAGAKLRRVLGSRVG